MRGVRLRRSAYWTLHPCFCNNVRVEAVDVVTEGHGADGCDPDSSWNVYIGNSTFATRDDCVALKAGKDWSGRLVNISTENVLLDGNDFVAGHGVAIGSETSGWIRHVEVRNSTFHSGTEALVRLKSMRGRGGGIEHVLYDGAHGAVDEPIQINLEYKKAKRTNASATPVIRHIAVHNVQLTAAKAAVLCIGLDDSPILNLSTTDVQLGGAAAQNCKFCAGHSEATHPLPCFDQSPK